MPNNISSNLNRLVRAVINSGEIGAASSNFVAFVQQADADRSLQMTGFDLSLIDSAGQGLSLDLFLIENQVVTLDSVINSTLSQIRAGKIQAYNFKFAVDPNGTVFTYVDRRSFPFKFNAGTPYSFILAIQAGGAGTGAVALELTVYGFYESEQQVKQTLFANPR